MGVPGRLGRYVVRRRLGSGGFATVWLAHDEQLDAEVAIKVLADNWVHDDSVRRRFLEEGRFLRRVESEHVVQVHDVGELEDGRPFLVLTYADRGTLADRLRDKPLDLEAAIGVVVQIGRGLQALHRRGLLHRDVKPANVLFRSTDDGERAVLSDLGLGKSLDEVSRITLPGGTPSYVAPEQAMGERLDARADQYSLGAVAYAALTGKSPHQVDGLGAAGRVSAPPPPSELGFAVPDRIDQAILRALQPDRDQRWIDVETFTRELVGGLDETTRTFEPRPAARPDPGVDADSERTVSVAETPAPVVSLPVELTVDAAAPAPASAPRRRRRSVWIVAAVLAALLGGAGGYAGQRYLAADQLVSVGSGVVKVKVPRGWASMVSEADWLPPGSAGTQPAVLVTAEGNSWTDMRSSEPGVFAGLMPGSAGPPELAKYEGCSGASEVATEPQGDGLGRWTLVSLDCGREGAVVLQRVVDTADRKRLWIQVRADDQSRARQVADSVSYTAGSLG